MNQYVSMVLALVCWSAIPSQSFASIVFSDDTFNDVDWSFTVQTDGAGGSATSTQIANGGDPDAYRQLSVTVNSGQFFTTNVAFNIRNNASYDPSISGAIGSIDYSESGIALGTMFGIGPGGGAALLQNGMFYWAQPTGDLHNSSTSWVSLLAAGLTADDFHTITDANAHPDFSASGAPILFGYNRHSGTGASTFGFTVTSGIDNWSLTVNSASVPEPATLWLFGLALAGLGAASRRRMR